MCSSGERVQAASVCSHSYCAVCLARELLRGPFACVVCKVVLSRNAFAAAVAAPSSLAREMKIRRRLAKIFNRVRGDFGSDEEFYQYQERVEDLTYRVVCGNDCEKEIAEYKQANQAAIVARNQENEAAEREQTERDRRDAAQRAKEREQREEADRREKAARRKEREKVLTKVQQGEIKASETSKRVEANVSKRRKREEEQEIAAAASVLVPPSSLGGPAKKAALPRPVGAVPLMAAEQKNIGNSYTGQLAPDTAAELLRRTRGCSSGTAAVLLRSRHELARR